MFAKQLCAAAVCAAFALPAWADKVYETDLVVVGPAQAARWLR